MDQDLRAKIIARAWKDETFRKKLLTNPKAAFEEFGVNIPKDVDLKVFSEDPSYLYFILPQPSVNVKAMSEAELGNIAAAEDTSNPCGRPIGFCGV